MTSSSRRRNFQSTLFAWKASSLCHKPLYFEDVELERYGQTCSPLFQPIIPRRQVLPDAAQLLPDMMGLEPPLECDLFAGLSPAGRVVLRSSSRRCPSSLRGALLEAGVWVAGALTVIETQNDECRMMNAEDESPSPWTRPSFIILRFEFPYMPHPPVPHHEALRSRRSAVAADRLGNLDGFAVCAAGTLSCFSTRVLPQSGQLVSRSRGPAIRSGRRSRRTCIRRAILSPGPRARVVAIDSRVADARF